MNRFQEAVAEFHQATGGPGTLDTQAGRELRAKLIMEEAVETVAALGFEVNAFIAHPGRSRVSNDGPDNDIIADYRKVYPYINIIDYLDGLCDLTYVVMGGAVNANVNIERHFEEVHQANMRKLQGPKRADGKQLKPEGWIGPDHQRVLDTYVPHG